MPKNALCRDSEELVKIVLNESHDPVVSARELHKVLEIKTEFRHWFPRMIEYGFVEKEDYTPVIFDHPINKQPTTDYAMKLDMAKEIAMIQRNEKGKQIRQYFIQVEKDFNSPEKIMARALKIAEYQISVLKIANEQQQQQIEADKPKVLFADAVSISNTTILIGDLAKLLKQNGIETGQKRLFEWLRKNGYLIKRKGADYNSPTQHAMELGLFEVKETVITHSDGHTTVNKTTKVTGKGQQYFINKFLQKKGA